VDTPRSDRCPLLHRDGGREVQPRLRLHFLPQTDTGQVNPMTETTYVSLYDLRVKLVQKALQDNSKLADKAAHDLAVHVLYALDHIPEKTRN
jgi:hypothetical protein